MKKTIYILFALFVLMGCEKDFQELNTDPNVVVPPAETLLAFALKEMVTSKGGGEWYHENHRKMVWAQYLIEGEANQSDVNFILPGNKYGTFYTKVLNHLNEMRAMIGKLSEEDQLARQKLIAVADIVQAFYALRITDQFGDIPYAEAAKGRNEGLLNPVYDKQEALLAQLVEELDGAITQLDVNQAVEIDFSKADFVYNGDPLKWIKCANAIKLRIASRLVSVNQSAASTIIGSVVSDGRLFESEEEQFTFDIGGDYRGSAGASFEWKGLMWAAKPMVDFMKKTVDPRLRVFYELNGYSQETIDAFADPADISPAVDLSGDNTLLYTTEDGEEIYGYRYIGAPTHRQDPTVGIPGYYQYVDLPNTVGTNAVMVSKFHRRLLQTCNYEYDGLPQATGNYVDVMLSYAEVCFMMSEYILKGLTTGDAEDWYNRGVESSLRTYDMLGSKQDLTLRVANKVYPYVPFSEAEISDYLATPEVAFDGVNDLEKVYIQQLLNFYRLPSEGWIMSMRSGYPKYGSTIFARFPIDDNELKFPRRIPTPEPGDLNLENWESTNTAQGFTNPRDEAPEVLNSQRLWWDSSNPAIGSGGN